MVRRRTLTRTDGCVCAWLTVVTAGSAGSDAYHSPVFAYLPPAPAATRAAGTPRAGAGGRGATTHTVLVLGLDGNTPVLTVWVFALPASVPTADGEPPVCSPILGMWPHWAKPGGAAPILIDAASIVNTPDVSVDTLWSLPTQTKWRPADAVPSAVSLVRERWFAQGFHIRPLAPTHTHTHTCVCANAHGSVFPWCFCRTP
jgi:hypothetical protein